jgi:hypothetical protein
MFTTKSHLTGRPINMTKAKLMIAYAFLTMMMGCMTVEQNIQPDNTSGKIADNRWDYYNAVPVHYTSTQITVYQDQLALKNEMTDAFSGTLTVNDRKKNAYILFNDKTIKLDQFTDQRTKDSWVKLFVPEGVQKDQFGHKRQDYYAWTDWYQDKSGKYALFIQRNKNILFTAFRETPDRTQTIGYLPSRYLGCKKIAELMKASNQRQVAALLQTALVAGVQSYTNYSTVSYSDSYGNFGYGTARDYSWAGDRASDALSTVFNGSADSASLQAAWSSLNCY